MIDFLFFKMFPALKFIFEMGYIPQPDDFKELTPMQYDSFRRKTPAEELRRLEGQKIYAFLPENPSVYNKLVNKNGDDLLIVEEENIAIFARASQYIERTCGESGRDFAGLADKLAYLAQRLPDCFTEGTSYALAGKRKRPAGE